MVDSGKKSNVLPSIKEQGVISNGYSQISKILKQNFKSDF